MQAGQSSAAPPQINLHGVQLNSRWILTHVVEAVGRTHRSVRVWFEWEGGVRASDRTERHPVFDPARGLLMRLVKRGAPTPDTTPTATCLPRDLIPSLVVVTRTYCSRSGWSTERGRQRTFHADRRRRSWAGPVTHGAGNPSSSVRLVGHGTRTGPDAPARSCWLFWSTRAGPVSPWATNGLGSGPMGRRQ